MSRTPRPGGPRRLVVVVALVGTALTGAQAAASAQTTADGTTESEGGSSSPWDSDRKTDFGHYVNPKQSDTPEDAAEVCESPGVEGVYWRQGWVEVEPVQGEYDFSGFQDVLDAIAASDNPDCKLFLMVRYKSFPASDPLNPCPGYLQDYAAPNASSNANATAYSCFMWEPFVVDRFNAMLAALADEYDEHPNVEGFIYQETAHGFNGAYCQNLGNDNCADGEGTYTPEAFRDALLSNYRTCAEEFEHSWCVSFMNFLSGNLSYMGDIAEAMEGTPNWCISGPDVLPSNASLYVNEVRIYHVIVDHVGCRSNSAQHASYIEAGPDLDDYEVTEDTICVGDPPQSNNPCTMEEIFGFAVGGTFGSFDNANPYDSGLCVNSFLFWNHKDWVFGDVPGERTWEDALPVIAGNPYGLGWTVNCAGGGLPVDLFSGVECTETVTGIRPGPLTVADGTVCLADGAHVAGPVTVSAGASVVARDVKVAGPVSAQGASSVVLVDSQVAGPVSITGSSDRVVVVGSTVAGPVTVDGNSTAGGEPIVISGNEIADGLSCSGNDPAPVNGGVPNTGNGPKTGQCADL
jgi:hypothetical protein